MALGTLAIVSWVPLTNARHRAAHLRPATATWAIRWVDSRVPHGPLDPPVKGRFENGVGTFYSDGDINGKPVRTRYVWSQITKMSGRWEQAYLYDAGKTWDTNWVMALTRTPAKERCPATPKERRGTPSR